jgi:hypothetical protein
LPEPCQQIAGGERRANLILRERTTLWVEDVRPFRQAAVGQRDIRCDDDIAGPGLLSDPVIHGTEAWTQRQLHSGVRRHRERGVGHNDDTTE